ncbi:hypothetical protein BGZ88_007554 [Linnemannia elongata]|nr:hypothetical protein BGZ88_007554 [Linnemannia elongata]
MNHAPLSFDQTGYTPNHPPVLGPSGPSLNNKRRSLADLLFVPTKIKTKRSSSSSVSSVDSSSYRQDETGQDLPGNVNVSWSNHPKSASATSTTSTSSTGSMSGSAGLTTSSTSTVPQHLYQQQQQRMSLESQASPPVRKSSTVKGVGKGVGSGGLGSSSSPKTFQCTGYPGCNMVFTRSEHLARHERKHTGEKPYKCIVANCPRTFSRYDNMIQHTQTHSDRTKRDSLVAVAAAASAAGVGSGPHSRSSSVQSTPLLPGRPRGGSSPVVFGPSWDEHHRRTQNNSPAASPYNASPAFSHHHQQQQQQYQHPYSPHYQHHPQQHQQQQPLHPIQWSLPSGAPAGSSPSLSAQYYIHHHGAESHPYLPGHHNPSAPVVRTLKANSRSLPHLQARASPMASSSTADSPSFGLHQSMSTMEIEELRRRKSEVLLPSSFSGSRAVSSTSAGYDQGVGLGMSPFTPTTSHPQSLPQVEKLTAGEQERLNEHRRSAQAMFFKMNAGREGSMDIRRTPEYSEGSSSIGEPSQQQQQHHHYQPLGVNTTLRSGSTGPALPQVHQLSALERDRLLEHRKSTPELRYDAKMKRSSNDPTDMVVQPLPSRDARSGMQWFSQISTPVTSSPRSSLTPRESNGGGGPSFVKGAGHSSFLSSSRPSSGDPSMVLPPILGPYEEPQRDRQGRLRSHSSHIHPLSRPLTQVEPSSLAQFSSSEEPKDQRQQVDGALSPRLERHWEEQYFPIRKRHVVETIEQMDSRDFLGLKYQVAEHHANEQFRNPEFLGNMTAILCVIRAPHTAWKGGERRQGSQGSVASASEQGITFAGSRRTSRDMEVDDAERRNMAAAAPIVKTEDGASAVKKEPMSESMDVDDGSGDGQSVTTSKDVVVQPCRFALDIDVDSFSRDPEPDLRGFEGLTINSLFPTRSFVAGFEDTPAEPHINASDKERYLSTHNGYPSNARLGRFYLPERSYRTPESLATQPDPNDRWVCCRFEEYHGVSIWVLESVLDKYHEISRRHKMALTLVGATVHHREAVYSPEDWEIHSGEQYEVKAKESVLYPEMIHQVWRDMYHQHHRQAQYQHQQQQRAPPMPQVATYEEYQRNLIQADPRRDSYQPLQQQQQALPRDRTGPYYSYSDYRQQQQFLHREDLSSAPSSPQSPRHDEFPDESPQQYHQQYQQHQRQGSSSSASANMHRRISIAELCNPMQSLATERAQRREETASKRTSM